MTAGLAIYDTMQYVKPQVSTICIGQAATMGAFLLAGGATGKRLRPARTARIMIHQPLGGVQGQATDIEIQAREILRLKATLNEHPREAHGPAARADREGHRARLLHGRRRGEGVRHHRRGDRAQAEGDGEEGAVRSGGVAGSPARQQPGERARDEEAGLGEARDLELLLLRQVAEGSEEAHRRADGLHLRRVHRALQRHHRGGDRRRGEARAEAPRSRARRRSRRSSTST